MHFEQNLTPQNGGFFTSLTQVSISTSLRWYKCVSESHFVHVAKELLINIVASRQCSKLYKVLSPQKDNSLFLNLNKVFSSLRHLVQE